MLRLREFFDFLNSHNHVETLTKASNPLGACMTELGGSSSAEPGLKSLPDASFVFSCRNFQPQFWVIECNVCKP